MTMKKQWRKELRGFQRERTRLAKGFTKESKRLFVAMTRAERGFDRQTKRLDRRISILEGRLS